MNGAADLSPSAATPNSRGARTSLAIAALLVAGGAALFFYLQRESPPAPPSFPLPAISVSPFLNTKPDVQYVGSDACRSCHLSHDASYHRTGMGRSMAAVDLDREPPDGAFDHPKSKRRYQVVRKNGQLWHRELLLNGGSEEIVLCEYPLKYVVGSGRHSLTYLVETDGFLVESPVTWYTAKKAWAMSPGYDRENHSGFERAIGESCLVCHAGQAEPVGNTLHVMNIKEAKISCERCHGPGALHVERHLAAGIREVVASQETDHTIVNPARLERNLAEAICQQCHLRSNASVLARGRKFSDFRPGLPLQDFRHDFRLDVPDAAMTVVGHVEQMHLSRCYQASKTLTCLTCHDPHDEPRPKKREAYYKDICLSCHEPERCKVDSARLHKESPSNNCVQCHMPTAPTEIPHLAFTHHKIGIHDPSKEAKSSKEAAFVGTLEPFLDLSRLSDVDQRRSLGMAYVEVANMSKDPGAAQHYREQALKLMTQVRDDGLRDPALDAWLARLRFDLELDGVQEFAASALAGAGPLDPQDRCNALFLVADSLAREGKRAEAFPFLHELTKLRRHSVQMLLLAKCQQSADDAESISALEAAVRINPRLAPVQQHLAEHYRRQGNAERAAYHDKRAAP